jgi:hypothetical protein
VVVAPAGTVTLRSSWRPLWETSLTDPVRLSLPALAKTSSPGAAPPFDTVAPAQNHEEDKAVAGASLGATGSAA